LLLWGVPDKFNMMKERLVDAADLLELRKAKRTKGRKRPIPLVQAKRDLGSR
jgi:hypothetical protein